MFGNRVRFPRPDYRVHTIRIVAGLLIALSGAKLPTCVERVATAMAAVPHRRNRLPLDPGRDVKYHVLKLMPIHFVVHDEGDSVGVVVVEGVKTGDALTGWIMDQDKTVQFKAGSDIPIGHKLAIRPLQPNDTAIKYGVDIGRVIAPVAVGEHVHIHNLKTKRW